MPDPADYAPEIKTGDWTKRYDAHREIPRRLAAVAKGTDDGSSIGEVVAMLEDAAGPKDEVSRENLELIVSLIRKGRTADEIRPAVLSELVQAAKGLDSKGQSDVESTLNEIEAERVQRIRRQLRVSGVETFELPAVEDGTELIFGELDTIRETVRELSEELKLETSEYWQKKIISEIGDTVCHQQTQVVEKMAEFREEFVKWKNYQANELNNRYDAVKQTVATLDRRIKGATDDLAALNKLNAGNDKWTSLPEAFVKLFEEMNRFTKHLDDANEETLKNTAKEISQGAKEVSDWLAGMGEMMLETREKLRVVERNLDGSVQRIEGHGSEPVVTGAESARKDGRLDESLKRSLEGDDRDAGILRSAWNSTQNWKRKYDEECNTCESLTTCKRTLEARIAEKDRQIAQEQKTAGDATRRADAVERQQWSRIMFLRARHERRIQKLEELHERERNALVRALNSED